MSGRHVDDDTRNDVRRIDLRLQVVASRLFNADGTPVDRVDALAPPPGAALADILVSGSDFDGEPGIASSVQVVGLRLEKLGFYVAADDPVRKPPSVLAGRIHSWPRTLDELTAFDEQATLPAAAATAMRRRIDCSVADISLAKNIYRRNDSLTAVAIAAAQASLTLRDAGDARDRAKAHLRLGGEAQGLRTDTILAPAIQETARAIRACTVLTDLLDRHRLAIAPKMSAAARAVVVMGETCVRAAQSLAKAWRIRNQAPGQSVKDVSEALRVMTSMVAAIDRFTLDEPSFGDTQWAHLKSLLAPLVRRGAADRDRLVAATSSVLDRIDAMLSPLTPTSPRVDAVARILAINGERIFMLLHSARLGEAIRLFPWLAAPHGHFWLVEGGMIGAVAILLELERCLLILKEMVRRTPDGPNGADRLTTRRATQVLARSGSMRDALDRRRGGGTWLRETAFSFGLVQAALNGQPLHTTHPIPAARRGQIGWNLRDALGCASTATTTADTLLKTRVFHAGDMWRRDVPRYFGMTIVDYLFSSLQTILPVRGRGGGQRTRNAKAREIDLDQSLYQLGLAMLDKADPSGRETALLKLRLARGRADLEQRGEGLMRLGQRMIRAHRPRRVDKLLENVRTSAGGRPLRLVDQFVRGYDPQTDAAPCADQSAALFWFNPEHDRAFWASFQHILVQPVGPDIMGPSPTRRDAIARTVSAVHAWSPRLIASLLPTDRTARIMTWLAHGYAGFASDPAFADLA